MATPKADKGPRTSTETAQDSAAPVKLVADQTSGPAPKAGPSQDKFRTELPNGLTVYNFV